MSSVSNRSGNPSEDSAAAHHRFLPGAESPVYPSREKTMKSLSLAFILALYLTVTGCTLISAAPSYAEKEFTIDSGKRHAVTVRLAAGQTVEGDFTIQGEELFPDLDFYVLGPHGQRFDNGRAMGGDSFQLTAEESGQYALFFDNTVPPASSCRVSLRYRIVWPEDPPTR